MEKELDLERATFDEIVFEDRNKSYGGYFLRVLYEKNVSVSALITCVAFAILAYGVNYYINYNSAPTEVYVPVEVVMEVSEEPLKKEELEKLPPPPPKLEQPKIEEVKYLPPVIKPDKSVKKEEQMKELDSLLNTNISTKNVEGEKTKKVDWEEGQEGGEIGGTGEKQAEVYTYAEVFPFFKGESTKADSDKAMAIFIKNRLQYPESAKRRKVTGIVYVEYTVTVTGKVVDVKIAKGKGLDPDCDSEAIRVIKSLPDFSPALQNGVPRQIRLIQKIKFQLN